MKTKVEAVLAASDVIFLLKSLLTDMLMSVDARMTNTVGTKEVVLRGGPPQLMEVTVCITRKFLEPKKSAVSNQERVIMATYGKCYIRIV